MSEHFGIKGKIDYYHSAIGESFEMSYCNNCKKNVNTAIIEFHQGIASDFIVFKCTKCKKTIWVSELKRKIIKNDKKCEICKKPTNQYDCLYYGSCGIYKKGKIHYVCSDKCENKMRKIMDKLRKKENG